jgi:glyoxylase-like metal-dependent hydrolase (beta-lactamase superfamily II)
MTAMASPLVSTAPQQARPQCCAPPQGVAPDLWLHASVSHTCTLRTEAGLLVVDPGRAQTSPSVYPATRAWSQAPWHTVVDTHGHADHALGLRAFLEAGERPQIVAQAHCPRRCQRDRPPHGWNTARNRRPFGSPTDVLPEPFDWPTVTFRDTLVPRGGDLEGQDDAAQGETDDPCDRWMPARSSRLTGDLVVWCAPNGGDPQKVPRCPVAWAEALERVASLGAEWLFPGHGLVAHGRDAGRTRLTDTARSLRVIVDQVLTRLNAGQSPEEVFHAAAPAPDLSTRPSLQARDDHPKCLVRHRLRQWGGWWNGNAADLLPAPWAAQAQEIAMLAGGVAALVTRGSMRLAQGDTVMAAHLAAWATRAAPTDREAQALKRDVYAPRLEEPPVLMAQGIFRAAMNDAREVLGEARIEQPEHPLVSYACVDEPKQHRMTAVGEKGR